jgi:RNA polymerase sigma-70 factor, ECF subfamily
MRIQMGLPFTQSRAGSPALFAAENEQGRALTTEEVYLHYQDQIAHWVQRLGGPMVDLDDLVQEVFLVIHQELHRFRGGTLQGWIYRITENLVNNQLRRNRLKRRLSRDWDEKPLDPSAFDLLDQAQVSAGVYRVLDRLPERYRSPLILFEIDGLRGEEIAQLKGVPTATVWVWLHRARALFLKRLAELQPALRPALAMPLRSLVKTPADAAGRKP